MPREWQQTKMKEYVMPEAVYYETLWAVRDLERMEIRLKELTPQDAAEMEVLLRRIQGIRDAISIIPEGYRSWVIASIVMSSSGASFPDKMWRAWKQRFLYTVARNLAIY